MSKEAEDYAANDVELIPAPLTWFREKLDKEEDPEVLMKLALEVSEDRADEASNYDSGLFSHRFGPAKLRASWAGYGSESDDH